METKQDRRAVVAVVFLALLLFGLFSNSRAFLLKGISDDFGVSYTGSGLIFFFSIISVMLTNFYAGALIAGFGVRIVYSVSILCIGILLILQGLTVHYSWFLAITVLLTVFTGSQNMSGNSLVARAFQRDGGIKLNLMHIFYAVGSMLAPLLTAGLKQSGLDWRAVFIGIGVAFLLLQFYVPFHRISDKTPRVRIPVREMMKEFSVPLSRWYSITIMFAVGCEVGISSWLVYTLQDGFHFSQYSSAFYLFLFFLLLGAGRYAGSRLARRGRLSRLLIPLGWLQFINALLAVAGLPQTALLLSGAGLFAAVFFPTLFYRMNHHTGERATAAAAVFLIGAGLGASLFPFLIGVLNDLAGIRWGLSIAAGSALLCVLSLHYLLKLEKKYVK